MGPLKTCLDGIGDGIKGLAGHGVSHVGQRIIEKDVWIFDQATIIKGSYIDLFDKAALRMCVTSVRF